VRWFWTGSCSAAMKRSAVVVEQAALVPVRDRAAPVASHLPGKQPIKAGGAARTTLWKIREGREAGERAAVEEVPARTLVAEWAERAVAADLAGAPAAQVDSAIPMGISRPEEPAPAAPAWGARSSSGPGCFNSSIPISKGMLPPAASVG